MPIQPNTVKQAKMIKGRSLWQDAWRRLRQNKAAIVSVFILVLVGILSVFPSLPQLLRYDCVMSHHCTIWHYDQIFRHGAKAGAGPSAQHWFGLDMSRRDLFVRTLYGARISLSVGLLATTVSVTVGILYGSIAGYFGRYVDGIMMRILEIFYALPFIFLVILLMSFFGRQFWLIFITIGLVEWMTMARIVRGQTLSIKNREYIEAARAMGVPSMTIIFRHIIPNLLGPVIIYATLLIPQVIILESFLSFLGLGIQQPLSSFGTLLSSGSKAILEGRPWLFLCPAAVMAVTLLCFNFIGDGLRDALDPRDY